MWAQNITTGTSPVKLDNKIYVVNNGGFGSWVTPDANGFFWYLADSANIDDTLAYFYSTGDDQWGIWLEFADSLDNSLGTTAVHRIQLDNTGPTTDIHISSGGDCKDFVQNVTISGSFTASDLHFGHFSMHAVPLSMSPNATTPSSGTASVVGGSWCAPTPHPAHRQPLRLRGRAVDLRPHDRGQPAGFVERRL